MQGPARDALRPGPHRPGPGGPEPPPQGVHVLVEAPVAALFLPLEPGLGVPERGEDGAPLLRRLEQLQRQGPRACATVTTVTEGLVTKNE